MRALVSWSEIGRWFPTTHPRGGRAVSRARYLTERTIYRDVDGTLVLRSVRRLVTPNTVLVAATNDDCHPDRIRTTLNRAGVEIPED